MKYKHADRDYVDNKDIFPNPEPDVPIQDWTREQLETQYKRVLIINRAIRGINQSLTTAIDKLFVDLYGYTDF